MKFPFLTIVIIGLLTASCNFETEGEIQHIYKLTSPNNQVTIYESYIESPMAFGSGKIEVTTLKTGEKYNPRLSGNFPPYVILGWIGNDTLKVIKFHSKRKQEVKIPSSKLNEVKKYKNFYLDIDHRTSTGGGAGWFNFDSLYFSRDSVFFIKNDSLGLKIDELGLLKGQVRITVNNDTISAINGEYYQRIEDVYAKIETGNKLGYPYMDGTNCEITPNYRLESSVFNNQPVVREIDLMNYK